MDQVDRKLLAVPVSKILLSDRRFENARRHRDDYFGDERLSGNFDLFVDPDTGVAPASGGDHRHVRLAELDAILAARDERMLIVYQHSGRVEKRTDAQARLGQVKEDFPASIAIWSGEVSMFFVTRNGHRSQQVKQRIETWLGPCAVEDNHAPQRLLT